MEYKLAELLDVPSLQALLDSLDELYSIPSAIIDMEGSILTKTAWQDVCIMFHRAHPESELQCIQSDTHIARELSKGKTQVVYKCPKGLIDTATPIIVDGRHLGNAFTGQFFLEPPDEEYFRALARQFGFDEEPYIDAMRRVPVITEDKHRKNLNVLAGLTQMLAEMGLQQKRQKESEARILESERRFQAAMNGANDGLWDWNLRTDEVYYSPRWKSMLGYAEDELDNTLDVWKQLVHPEDMEPTLSHVRDLTEGRQDKYEVEFRMRHKDGHYVDILSRASLMPDATGESMRLVGTHVDISERIQFSEKLENSLREKETLLKEIHHRVKNNMAVISSLLQMQSAYVRDQEDLEMFRESQGRISAMAMVHEHLYQSQNLAEIDVTDYLADLTSAIKQSFAGSRDIALSLNVDHLKLDIDVLIPCGLIMNELLTNAFKHAFHETQKPAIKVSLKAAANDHIQLSIIDNGCGLPEGFDIHRSTRMGLRLVSGLCRQIRATINWRSENGAVFELNFPRHIPYARA